MNKNQSLYIDLLRGVAAVVVMLHHYSNHIINGGKKIVDDSQRVFPDLGQEAVIVFFVLSGFVITYVSHEREKTFIDFLFKRMARFYSVVIPSVLILFICYFIATAISPSIFTSINPDHNLKHIGIKILSTLSFLNYNTFYPTYLPSGGPYWSLTCEWWYYILFAVMFYLSNKLYQLILIGFIVAFVGTPTLLLFPIWIFGVITFYALQAELRVSRNVMYITSLTSLILIVVLFLSGVRYSLLNTGFLFHQWYSHSTYFPYFWLVGIFLSVHIFATFKIFDALHPNVPVSFQKMISHLANVSFFLYLVHQPVMILLKAILPTEPFLYFIPLVTLIICLIIGKWVENLKFPVYQFLNKRFRDYLKSSKLVS